MLEQAQSISLSKQESVLQKQDRCKKTKVVTALNEESQHHFSKTRLKDAASQQERVSVWPNPGELPSEEHMWYFLRWTGEQTQNLSSDWDREANWAPTEEPSSKTLFYNLLSRPSARNPEGLQTWISFAVSLFQDGVILAADTPPPLDAVDFYASSMQQTLSFSLPLPPFLHPKIWKGTPWWHYRCFAMKLKQSLTWWSVQWCSEWRIFLALKKKKCRGLCVGTWKKFKNLCQNPTHLSVKAPKLTSCTAEKQCGNPALFLVSRPNSSQVNHILPALSQPFQLEKGIILTNFLSQTAGNLPALQHWALFHQQMAEENHRPTGWSTLWYFRKQSSSVTPKLMHLRGHFCFAVRKWK